MATTFTFEEVAQAPSQTFTFEDLQATPVPVQSQQSTTQPREFQFSDILAVPAAIGEVGLQMGTGALSQAAAGLWHGILSTDSVEERARKIQEMQEAGTYQPKTALGQGASQAVAFPFQKAMELTKQAGGAVGELVGGEQGRIAGEAIGEQVIPVAGAVAPLVPVARGTLSKPSAAKMSAKIEEINRLAPKVIVAKEGQAAGFVFDPAEVNPTRMNKTLSAYAGDQKLDFLAAEKNIQAAQAQIKKAIGLDQDVSLNQKTVKTVRDKLGERYEDVRKVGALPSNDALASQLRNSLIEEIPGVEAAARTANRVLLDNADAIASGELTGNSALNRIKEYRKLNQKIRDSGASDEAALLKGEAYLKVANILEDVIESGIKDKTVLDNFRKAREGIAKTYTVDAIINPETGVPNLTKLTTGKLAKAPLTGELDLLRRIASTFPEATASISKYGDAVSTLPRTGFGGSAGAVAGAAAGNTAMGSVIGAVTGVLGGKALRNRLLSESYQRKNLLPEYARNLVRDGNVEGDITIQSPLTQSMPRAVSPAPTSTLPVPYVREGEVYIRGEVPNWRMPRQESPSWYNEAAARKAGVDIPPDITPSQASRPALGFTPSAQGRNAFQNASLSDRIKAIRDAEIAAAEASAPRRPASGGMLFDLDPVTGRLRPADQGLKGATLDVIEDAGKDLASALAKLRGEGLQPVRDVSTWKRVKAGTNPDGSPKYRVIETEGASVFGEKSGKGFDLTINEKIALNKYRQAAESEAQSIISRFKEDIPEFKTLSQQAIRERIADRQWAAKKVDEFRKEYADWAKRSSELRSAFSKQTKQLSEAEMRIRRQEIVEANRKAEVARVQSQLLEEARTKIAELEALQDQLSAPRAGTGLFGGQGQKTRAAQRGMLYGE